MDLRKEYEQYQQAQRDAPMLAAAAQARNSTTSDRIVPSDVQSALLALMRREIKSLLPHPLRGLTDNFTDDAAPLMASLDAQGQAYWGPAPANEGDYAFKVTAVINQNKTFTVNVLGGTAQTLGGTPYIYDDEELGNVEEGWHIYVVYENLEPYPSYTEYGEWMPGIKASSAAVMAIYTAPHDLVFEIGRISKEYIGNVRQDHKGNIVMPAISNVVDIQTKLP